MRRTTRRPPRVSIRSLSLIQSRQSLRHPRLWRLSDIFKTVPRTASQAERDAAREEMGGLRARLVATNLASRPSLTGADPLIKIEVVLARRDPLYLEIADEVVQVDGMSEDAALAKLIGIARA